MPTVITPCQQGVTPVTPDLATELPAIFSSDLVAYWRMGEASGNELDYQTTYVAAPLVPVGVATTYDVTGLLPAAQDDGAYQKGTGGFSVTTSRAWFENRKPFGVLFLMRVDAMATGQCPVIGDIQFSGGGPAILGWGIELVKFAGINPRLMFHRAIAASDEKINQSVLTELTIGQSYYLCFGYDGATMSYWRDGALITTAGSTITVPPLDPLVVLSGNWTLAALPAHTITIDEIALVKRNPTTGDVANAYAATL